MGRAPQCRYLAARHGLATKGHTQVKTALQAFQACAYARNQHGNSSCARLHSSAWLSSHVLGLKGQGQEAKLKHERALKSLIHGLALYIDAHNELLDAHVGEDGYCGEPIRDIAAAVIALLAGERGRLDSGTLDHYIREMCEVGKVELDP